MSDFAGKALFALVALPAIVRASLRLTYLNRRHELLELAHRMASVRPWRLPWLSHPRYLEASVHRFAARLPPRGPDLLRQQPQRERPPHRPAGSRHHPRSAPDRRLQGPRSQHHWARRSRPLEKPRQGSGRDRSGTAGRQGARLAPALAPQPCPRQRRLLPLQQWGWDG